jgi:glycosyltransferase involved in cell wall biosynthesis
MTHDPARPLVSVVTVTFNAIHTLPKTVASLRMQGDGPWEWVVVDGASTDGSAAWLRAQGADRFVSEADAGIFEAMNKALALSRGRWLYFLNSGDAFADPSVLTRICEVLDRTPNEEIVFGDVIYRGPHTERLRRFHWLTPGRLLFGDLCHQGTFCRHDLFERIGGFDTSLRYNADFDWFLRAIRAGAAMRYVPLVIAHFDDGGAHVQAGQRHAEERDRVRARHLPLPLWRLGHFLLRAELKLRRLAGQAV